MGDGRVLTWSATRWVQQNLQQQGKPFRALAINVFCADLKRGEDSFERIASAVPNKVLWSRALAPYVGHILPLNR